MDSIETREIAVGGRNVTFKRYADGRLSCAYPTFSGGRQAHVTDDKNDLTFDAYISAMTANLARDEAVRAQFGGK